MSKMGNRLEFGSQIDWNKEKFYYWMQRELEKQLKEIYKIYRIGLYEERLGIWFLDNEDSISIPVSKMREIYDNEKSMKELSELIEMKYVARIKKRG